MHETIEGPVAVQNDDENVGGQERQDNERTNEKEANNTRNEVEEAYVVQDEGGTKKLEAEDNIIEQREKAKQKGKAPKKGHKAKVTKKVQKAKQPEGESTVKGSESGEHVKKTQQDENDEEDGEEIGKAAASGKNGKKKGKKIKKKSKTKIVGSEASTQDTQQIEVATKKQKPKKAKKTTGRAKKANSSEVATDEVKTPESKTNKSKKDKKFKKGSKQKKQDEKSVPKQISTFPSMGVGSSPIEAEESDFEVWATVSVSPKPHVENEREKELKPSKTESKLMAKYSSSRVLPTNVLSCILNWLDISSSSGKSTASETGAGEEGRDGGADGEDVDEKGDRKKKKGKGKGKKKGEKKGKKDKEKTSEEEEENKSKAEKKVKEDRQKKKSKKKKKEKTEEVVKEEEPVDDVLADINRLKALAEGKDLDASSEHTSDLKPLFAFHKQYSMLILQRGFKSLDICPNSNNYECLPVVDHYFLSKWRLYVECGRLPDPSKCDQMSTYLHLWEKDIYETTIEEAAARTRDVLKLLEDLDDVIDEATEEEASNVENWKWIRNLLRSHQTKSIDVASYRLLRDIEKNLHRIDIPTADFRHKDENFALFLWLRVQLPTPMPNPRRPPKPQVEVDFPEMQMFVKLPVAIDCDKMAVRALYLKYDHLSDTSDTYAKPQMPDEYQIDLYDMTKKEWGEKLFYKYENRDASRTPTPAPVPHSDSEDNMERGRDDELDGDRKKSEIEEKKEKRVLGPDDAVPIVPYKKLTPTASEFVISKEEIMYAEIRKALVKRVPDDVINLRRFTIIGGVYRLDLVYQPQQPQTFVTMQINITPLQLPKELKMAEFYVTYSPPEPPEAGVRRLPEEIEEELKRLEEELDKLILVSLTWPEHVIFLELPLVCHWNDDQKCWCKKDVYDLKHNEEKGQLTFRTGRFGTFALAVYRYANMPFQAWEMRPETNDSITLQITAAILMVEFNVKGGLVALTQLQNSPNNALQDLTSTYMKLPRLMRILQNSGVDLFPSLDAFCYVENTCEKHWPMERQLYFDMAQLGNTFNFAWSRWNLPASRRDAVLQMREFNLAKTKQRIHSMLHVTPLKATLVDCTEVSQTFNEEGVENMKFYSNLYFLMKGTTKMATRSRVSSNPRETVHALYELLCATRVLSLS